MEQALAKRKASAVHTLIESHLVALQNLLAGIRMDYSQRLTKGEDVAAIRVRMRAIENRAISAQSLVVYSKQRVRELEGHQNDAIETAGIRSEGPQGRKSDSGFTEPLNEGPMPLTAAAEVSR